MSSTAPLWRGLGLLALLILAACGGGDPAVPPSAPEVPSTPTATEPVPPAPHRAHLSVESVPGQRGAYSVGDSIVLYSRQDREARVEGTPRLAIKIGETVRFAHFAPWSGDVWPPERLQFQHQFVYEVHADDQDEDGISIAADAFDFAEGAFLNAAGEEVEVEITRVTPTETGAAIEAGRDLEMHPVLGLPTPRVCSDEREMALDFGTRGGRTWGPVHLVEDWNGEPIRVYFDEAAVRPDERERVTEWFHGVERLADLIQDQIGYPILKLGGLDRKGEARVRHEAGSHRQLSCTRSADRCDYRGLAGLRLSGHAVRGGAHA